ncbi:hypothetical protein [Streptomyces phaeochromogenes]|uniref:hypothetical protein n=1 Tax=Streptomyces phaeochromogenes TaxID=1923 RepID=UPI002E126C19|nr:hypothetical protein OG437_40920 [Streptomyces phaeochromogenes]
MTKPEISRLNPFDGLFLRAVHLQQIQLYTQALSHALGLAGGPGVVHGYGLALAADPGKPPSRIDVRPGLAVDGDGRILLSTSTIRVPLPKAGETLAWQLELVANEEPFGQEKSYGDLCVDPCKGDSGTAPFVGEGVDVRLAPLRVPAEFDQGSPAFRNRVASWHFEQERRKGAPLIPASDRDSTDEEVRPITGTDWAAPTGPVPGPVGIALLLRTAAGFVLDVWAARRDRVQTAPETGWTHRLAMRPWQVFIAQLLQFQDQLGSAWPATRAAASDTPPAPSARPDVSTQLTEALEHLQSGKRRKPIDLVENVLATLRGDRAAAPGLSLVGLGFEDLPPAGYLPAQKENIYDRIRWLFPEGSGVVFNAYRADTIVELVARAQHADRIPLIRDGGIWPPRIEIMVPVPEPYTDGHDLQTTRSWVAFRRAVCIPLYTEDPMRAPEPAPAITATADAGTSYRRSVTDNPAAAGGTVPLSPMQSTSGSQPDSH